MVNFDSPANQCILAYMQRLYSTRPTILAQRLQEVIDEPMPDISGMENALKDNYLRNHRITKGMMIADIRFQLNKHLEEIEQVPDLKNAPILLSNQIKTTQVGTHPDLVEYLWETLGNNIPPGCACTIKGSSSALLAHPHTGVIFGYASGTSTRLLRLPEPEFTAERRNPSGTSQEIAGTTVYAEDFGADWTFLTSNSIAYDQALCQKAFEYAGTLR